MPDAFFADAYAGPGDEPNVIAPLRATERAGRLRFCPAAPPPRGSLLLKAGREFSLRPGEVEIERLEDAPCSGARVEYEGGQEMLGVDVVVSGASGFVPHRPCFLRTLMATGAISTSRRNLSAANAGTLAALIALGMPSHAG